VKYDWKQRNNVLHTYVNNEDACTWMREHIVIVVLQKMKYDEESKSYH